MIAAQDPASLLCLVVDCDAESWKMRHQVCSDNQINFGELAANMSVFCHAHVTMHRQNSLLVLACGKQLENGCRVVYPRVEEGDDFVPAAHTLAGILSEGLMATQDGDNGPGGNSVNFISQALSTALCVMNRQLLHNPAIRPRILVAQLSRDHAPSYNNVMNCIFSADKAGIPIDALVLKTTDESQFLQQACYMTKGVYQRPLDQRDVLQQLLEFFLPSTAARALLNAPFQKVVEFKASCFCHKKPVEFAYMCSVCLALTCSKAPVCDTCGTEAAHV